MMSCNIMNIIFPNIVINDRICYNKLKGIWYNILIINWYAPTDDKWRKLKCILRRTG